MIIRDLVNHLKESAAIRDYTSNRIYANHRPQHVRGDCLVLTLLNRNPAMSLSGEVGQHECLIEISAISELQYKADALAELVRNRISGYRGRVGRDGREIQSTRIVNSTEESLPATAGGRGSDQWTHIFNNYYALHIEQPVPTFT